MNSTRRFSFTFQQKVSGTEYYLEIFPTDFNHVKLALIPRLNMFILIAIVVAIASASECTPEELRLGVQANNEFVPVGKLCARASRGSFTKTMCSIEYCESAYTIAADIPDCTIDGKPHRSYSKPELKTLFNAYTKYCLTTEAPDTEAPTTEAPTTETPTTEAPTTEAPTTEAPTTEAPTTEAPITEAPTTEAPATEAPITEAPQVDEPGRLRPEVPTDDVDEENAESAAVSATPLFAALTWAVSIAILTM